MCYYFHIYKIKSALSQSEVKFLVLDILFVCIKCLSIQNIQIWHFIGQALILRDSVLTVIIYTQPMFHENMWHKYVILIIKVRMKWDTGMVLGKLCCWILRNGFAFVWQIAKIELALLALLMCMKFIKLLNVSWSHVYNTWTCWFLCCFLRILPCFILSADSGLLKSTFEDLDSLGILNLPGIIIFM